MLLRKPAILITSGAMVTSNFSPPARWACRSLDPDGPSLAWPGKQNVSGASSGFNLGLGRALARGAIITLSGRTEAWALTNPLLWGEVRPQ
jgi:hypothetical protein